MSLEHLRDPLNQEVEASPHEQSTLKRTGRKRKAPQDDEVSYKNNNKRKKKIFFFSLNNKMSKF